MKPIHPILVHFPIALLALSAAVDLVAVITKIESSRVGGRWSEPRSVAWGQLRLVYSTCGVRR